jgi:hypothetical protein
MRAGQVVHRGDRGSSGDDGQPDEHVGEPADPYVQSIAEGEYVEDPEGDPPSVTRIRKFPVKSR